MTPETQLRDVAVIGGGATGLAAAIAAASAGRSSVVFAPPAPFPPGRTAALMQGSVDLLTEIGVWPALAAHAAELRGIRIVDATRRLIRAPEVTFWASEIGMRAFGYNIPNGLLVDALRRYAAGMANLLVVEETADAVAAGENALRINSAGTVVDARLTVAADGGQSIARGAAGIEARRWSYGQAALVATFTVEHPHGGVSTEFHTENGPFTLVPLPGRRVSLVWVDRPDVLHAAAEFDARALGIEAEERSQSMLGKMTADSAPAVFPLAASLAERYSGRRTILIGEAAHRFPPIGAQGLNLGFRDVAAFRRMLALYPADPASAEALAWFNAARSFDVRSRTLAVDLLNRSLLTDFLPAQLLRAAGLSVAASSSLARRALMRLGMGDAKPDGSATAP